MRIAIIVDDNRVFVNGCAETVDCSALALRDIHAVQWYDTWGEVEYATDFERANRKPNERITSFSPFQSYQEAWETEARRPLPGLSPNATPVAATPRSAG